MHPSLSSVLYYSPHVIHQNQVGAAKLVKAEPLSVPTVRRLPLALEGYLRLPQDTCANEVARMMSLARVCSSQLSGQGSICPLSNCTQESNMTEQRTRTGGAQRGRGGMPWERPFSLCVQTKIPDRLVETAFGFKIPVTWHCHRHHSRH